MAMELVENMIRSGSIRRRSDRSIGSGSDALSFAGSLRSVSFRSASLPHRVRTKSDLARPASSIIECNSFAELDGLPDLDQPSPISYDEFYTTCDATSTKSSLSDHGKEPMESIDRPTTKDGQEKHDETTADVLAESTSSGTLSCLQPKPAMICHLWPVC